MKEIPVDMTQVEESLPDGVDLDSCSAGTYCSTCGLLWMPTSEEDMRTNLNAYVSKHVDQGHKVHFATRIAPGRYYLEDTIRRLS